jgi:hypothetical protein
MIRLKKLSLKKHVSTSQALIWQAAKGICRHNDKRCLSQFAFTCICIWLS